MAASYEVIGRICSSMPRRVSRHHICSSLRTSTFLFLSSTFLRETHHNPLVFGPQYRLPCRNHSSVARSESGLTEFYRGTPPSAACKPQSAFISSESIKIFLKSFRYSSKLYILAVVMTHKKRDSREVAVAKRLQVER